MHNPRKHWRPKPKPRNRLVEFIKSVSAMGFAIAVTGLPFFFALSNYAPQIVASAQGCEIKGNISIDTGERIYHLPGQEYYSQTKISPEHGEKWFCSEDEARAAGWRKARG